MKYFIRFHKNIILYQLNIILIETYVQLKYIKTEG